MTRPKVQINYKSGRSMTFTCKSFSVTRNIGGGLKVEWEGCNPKPLLVGIDDIESVWEIL